MSDKIEEFNFNPIWVNQFTESSAKDFCKDILKAGETPNVPIVIYIDSYGGYVDALSSMVSVLDAVPNTIVTVAIGKAMSCGAVLLSCGHLRYVAPHARVMVHEISTSTGGSINDVVNHTNENIRLNKYFMSLLAKNCGKTLKQFQQSLPTERRDRYMDAKESVKFGIADHIGLPKIIKTVIYDIV